MWKNLSQLNASPADDSAQVSRWAGQPTDVFSSVQVFPNSFAGLFSQFVKRLRRNLAHLGEHPRPMITDDFCIPGRSEPNVEALGHNYDFWTAPAKRSVDGFRKEVRPI